MHLGVFTAGGVAAVAELSGTPAFAALSSEQLGSMALASKVQFIVFYKFPYLSTRYWRFKH